MRKKQNALLMVTIMAFMSLSGCFGEEKTEIGTITLAGLMP